MRWNGEVVDDRAAFFVPPNAAFLSQVPQLISDSVADNVGLGPVSDEALATALGLAAITERHRRDARRRGDADRAARVCGCRVASVNGWRPPGRSCTSPELVVLDDLSSALDVETEVELWRNLADAGMTVLAVSHRAVAFERADQIITLSPR